ncbi:mitoguardin 1-like [Carassius auratus]|uniref:Mitoguardin 1-like n=1 Tax=Carassius auratus TaxID=7957 RepID=A0A6P6QDZ8_CARAU|nr:mitoguardin 1-like [Carassius auratus]
MMTEDLFRNTQVSMKLAALRFMDLPLSVYSSLPQVSLSTSTKKLFAATAFGAISLIYLARRFRRRKGKKKAGSPVEQETFEFLNTVPLKKGFECQNLPLRSKNGYACNVVSSGSLYSKLSGSLLSLASVSNLFYCHHL